MSEDKIQTGLRIPITRYNELKEMADKSGASLNSIILALVDIGLSAISRGIEQEARFQLQNQQHTDVQ